MLRMASPEYVASFPHLIQGDLQANKTPVMIYFFISFGTLPSLNPKCTL